MPPYLTAAKLVNYLPSIELGLVEKLREFRNHEYYGSKECGDLFAKFELAFSDYKYFSNKYIPPGTILASPQSATATVSFTGFDVTLLGNEDVTGFLVINFLDGSTLSLVDISNNFDGFTLDQFLDFIVAQINTISGWSASHTGGDDFITITCPDTLGDTINMATVSLAYDTFYYIFNTYQNPSFTLVPRDVINNPSSAGYGYTVSINAISGVNHSPTLVFHHNESATITYTIPGLLVLAGTSMTAAYNPITDKIYVTKIASDSTYHLYIVTLDAVGLSASSVEVALPGTIVLSNQGTAKLFNPVDNTFNVICYDTGLTQWGFLKVASDSVVTPTISFLPCGANEMLRPLINTVTGAIAYMVISDQFEEISIGGTITVIIPTGTSLSCRGISFYNQGGVWKYLFFFYPAPFPGSDPMSVYQINSDYTLGAQQTFEGSYSNGNLPNATFINELNLIQITYIAAGLQYVDIYEYSPLTPALGLNASFTMSPTQATPAFYGALDSCIVWGSSNNLGNDLFYMRLQTEAIELSGVFTGGITGVEWLEENNCLTDLEANTQFDQLLMWLGISDCGENTLSEQTSIEELLRGTRLLGTHTGKFITTSTGAYIRIS